MEQELTHIMSQLANAGIRVDVFLSRFAYRKYSSPSFLTENQYLFSRAGLLKLRDEGKLNIPGIEEFGLTIGAVSPYVRIPHSPP